MPAQPDEAATDISAWTHEHDRWNDLLRLVDDLQQTAWVAFAAPFHQSSHMLVATRGQIIAGFLRFVIQEIGADEDRPPVTLAERPLTEAKVLAFAVVPALRRHGIGRALQGAALDHARRLGCYQVRSHSGGGNSANHQLKLAMGFAVHPIVRGQDTTGVYFIMPLRRGDG
jgi:GNAT superfamily N-acetyltransferase